MLMLMGFPIFAQDITSSSRVKELFGARFISMQEAGFTDSLTIPFSEDMLRIDGTAWIVPMLVDGLPQYNLIQPEYSPAQHFNENVLNLADTEKMIQLLSKLRPNFPLEGDKVIKPFEYFYMTSDTASSKHNLNYRKTISLYKDQILVVNLPENANIGELNPEYISFFVLNKNGSQVFGIEGLPDGAPQIEKQNIKILRLVLLAP